MRISHLKVNQAIAAVIAIQDDVISELEDVAEYSKNELRSARIILKEAKEYLVTDYKDELSDYLETYHEITRCIWEAIDSDFLNEIKLVYDQNGTGAMYELARAYTDEFQRLHHDRQWDGDFFDEIENFMNLKRQGN